MSRLSLMIFTLVIMTTILCNHSVHGGNFHKVTRYSDIPQHKQDVRQHHGNIVGHCKSHTNHNKGILFRIPTPL